MSPDLHPDDRDDTQRADPLTAALGALPERPLDPVLAERIRLRARISIRPDRHGALSSRAAWAWYRVEPVVTAGVVVGFLVWTFDAIAILFS